jgi:glycosyltransferase involved in cell wall biosynthesis
MSLRVARVVHVVDSLRLGGTEMQAVTLARALAARGVVNHLVYSHAGPLAARLDGSDVSTERLAMGGGFLRPGMLGFVLRLARTLRARRADVVQSYGFYRNLPAVLAGRLAGVGAILTGRRGFGTHLTPAQHRVDRLAYRLAHRTVVNAAALRTWVIEHDAARPDAVVVIPNCVAEGGPITPARDPVVGMVANFRPPKDHVTFLHAAARVVETVPTAVIHLIGAGPEEATARRLAETLGLGSHVRFLGALEPDHVWTAVNRFAVAVLSSRSEGMPNTVLEAMAAARPVVATAVGDVPALVRDGVTGFLVPPGDAAALGAAIGRLLKDTALAADLGAAGRRHVLATHGAERIAQAFVDLYRTLGVPA